MNGLSLVPIPDPIPVSWIWFEGLNILTFAIHIALANILVGGGLLTLYLRLRNGENATISPVTDRLPTMFALTVNFGVAPLLFLQVLYGHFFYVSATLSAAWWLSIIALLILGYYAFYINQHRQKALPPKGTSFLGAGTVMTLLVAFILTSVMTMMASPDVWQEYFNNPHGTILNLLEPVFLPRFLHFLMASFALGGLFMALLARFGRGTQEGLKIGMDTFAGATILQMAAGVWWFLALDKPVQLFFMNSIPAMGVLLLAVALTLPALSAGLAKKPVAAACWTMATILAMSGVRAITRNVDLAPYFSPTDLNVTGEVSPLILFLVSLIIGLVVLAYMLRIGFKTQGEEG